MLIFLLYPFECYIIYIKYDSKLLHKPFYFVFLRKINFVKYNNNYFYYLYLTLKRALHQNKYLVK